MFGLMLLFRLVYPRNCGWCDSLNSSDTMHRSRGLQWLRTKAVLNVELLGGAHYSVDISSHCRSTAAVTACVMNTIADSLNAPLGSCDLPDAWR